MNNEDLIHAAFTFFLKNPVFYLYWVYSGYISWGQLYIDTDVKATFDFKYKMKNLILW